MTTPAVPAGKKTYSGYLAHRLVPTAGDIEGPFYLPGAPERAVLVGYPTLVLTGRVLGTDGLPRSNALLDFWQANEDGVYDEKGFTLRGKQWTNEKGEYNLETVKPGHYPIDEHEFRCAHIHVKVSADGCVPLMTQLYFLGDEYNAQDHWFAATRVVKETSLGRATFDFVLARV